MSLTVAVEHSFANFSIDVAFEAPAGVTALFGRSGAGKTTLVNAVAGLLRPDRGRVAVNGWELFDTASRHWLPPHHRRVGYVFQEGRLFPHLTVRQNLAYGRWFAGGGERSEVDHVVDLLGIGSLLERRPGGLSGGEKQRVALGRALLAKPRLLLMDEPLAALDEARKTEILPYLESIRDETRVPILYVSHNAGEVARLADTVVLLDAGRMVAAGTASDVFGRLDLDETTDERGMSALLDGIVMDIDEAFDTTIVAIDGARIELAGRGFTRDAHIRLRVHASDVALARDIHDGLSIRNQLPCTIAEIGREEGAHVTLALSVGSQRLLSRITRKSLSELGLAEGHKIVALLKAVSVESGGRS